MTSSFQRARAGSQTHAGAPCVGLRLWLSWPTSRLCSPGFLRAEKRVDGQGCIPLSRISSQYRQCLSTEVGWVITIWEDSRQQPVEVTCGKSHLGSQKAKLSPKSFPPIYCEKSQLWEGTRCGVPGPRFSSTDILNLSLCIWWKINFIYELINTFIHSSNDNSLNAYYVLNTGKIKVSLKKTWKQQKSNRHNEGGQEGKV